jgi:hypothetical protein
MRDRKIEIRDPGSYDPHDHDLVLTSPYDGNSNVVGFTTAELCLVYVAIEERLELAGMTRPRMIRMAEMARLSEEEARP